MEAVVDIWKTTIVHRTEAAIYALFIMHTSALNISLFAQLLGVDNQHLSFRITRVDS